MSDIEALRQAMRSAQVSGKGQYIEAGIHELSIERGICKRTNHAGTPKENYIIEFKVLSSTNPTHEVGSTRSYVENVANQGWMGRFKAFIAAALGLDPESKLGAEAEEAIADVIAALRYDEFRVSKGLPENFLKGRRVRCEGMPGTSVAKGTPVTHKKWTPIAEGGQ